MAMGHKSIMTGKNIALTMLMLSVAGLMLFHTFFNAPQTAVQVYQCADLMQGCTVSVEGKPLEIRFSATPNALHPFALTIKRNGLKAVSASFAMVGMEMGENHYQLMPVQENVWEAKVILPVCVTGRRDWILTLSLDKVQIRIPFSA